ncbi:MAG: DNA-binding protein [Thaumarchaeota archaeon]|nr:MAG: DNA-binding protein [Nitrososphaerota archaeon]
MSLFDSSAIINLCNREKASKLFNEWTLDLTIYELGNATWKLTRIRKIKPEEAFTVLEALTGIYGKMRKTKIKNHEKTLKIALKENLTFYDAAYISVAIENNLTLITDDEKLYKAARKYTKVLRSHEVK